MSYCFTFHFGALGPGVSIGGRENGYSIPVSKSMSTPRFGVLNTPPMHLLDSSYSHYVILLATRLNNNLLNAPEAAST